MSYGRGVDPGSRFVLSMLSVGELMLCFFRRDLLRVLPPNIFSISVSGSSKVVSSSSPVGLCRSDSSTRVSDESATPGRDSSERRVAAAGRVGVTRPTSGTSTVGQVSRSRSDSGSRADGSTPLIHVRKAMLHARQRPRRVGPTLTPPGPGSSMEAFTF
jgi:hypothetical protein